MWLLNVHTRHMQNQECEVSNGKSNVFFCSVSWNRFNGAVTDEDCTNSWRCHMSISKAKLINFTFCNFFFYFNFRAHNQCSDMKIEEFTKSEVNQFGFFRVSYIAMRFFVYACFFAQYWKLSFNIGLKSIEISLRCSIFFHFRLINIYFLYNCQWNILFN